MKDLPPVNSICIFDDKDVKIVAHTHVAHKKAAVWQFYDTFGYGFAEHFSELEECVDYNSDDYEDSRIVIINLGGGKHE